MRKTLFLALTGIFLVFGAISASAGDAPWGQTGWGDADKDLVIDYDDKCPKTPYCCHVDKVGCPIDEDGDGVCDTYDKCPGTPKGCVVDEKGCPKDSDGDGVCDGLDKCPDTPKGVKVDAVGCCIDSDKDGVCDYLDKCPDTAMDLKVDSSGCPIKVESGAVVHFDTDKAKIRPEGMGPLQDVAAFMKKYPETTAAVTGHCDSRGTEKYNLKLGDRRSSAVQAYLVSQGVAASRLTTDSKGEAEPVAPNTTSAGMAKNRRAVVKVTPAYEKK